MSTKNFLNSTEKVSISAVRIKKNPRRHERKKNRAESMIFLSPSLFTWKKSALAIFEGHLRSTEVKKGHWNSLNLTI